MKCRSVKEQKIPATELMIRMVVRTEAIPGVPIMGRKTRVPTAAGTLLVEKSGKKKQKRNRKKRFRFRQQPNISRKKQ